MSAIAGVLSWSDRHHARQLCQSVAERLIPYGPHHQALYGNPEIALARCLYRTLPEDIHDQQPWQVGDGSWYVADARIDNRREVEQALGLPGAEATRQSDANLLFRAWERWSDQFVDRVIGDFAAARWVPAHRRLTLVRSALSMKPLYLASTPTLFAFSTMPEALVRLPQVGAQPDHHLLARRLAQAPRDAHATGYRNIRSVSAGEMIQVADERYTRSQTWDPTVEPRFGRSIDDAAEEMRALLDQAVQARTRRAKGRIATHLSGGRDSSAVTASAARCAPAGSVLALTGAPRADYRDAVSSGWLADEGATAAETAARHPMLHHEVCRYVAPFDLAELRAIQSADQRPLSQPSQLPWWLTLNRRAAEGGASVMLTGSFGNLTISAGGEAWLPDLRRSSGSRAWWRQARRFGGSRPLAWRSVLHGSFGVAVPSPLYRLLRRTAGADTRVTLPLLQQPYRHAAEEACQDVVARPSGGNANQQRRDLLLERETGEKVTLRLWGLDVRDPTADRRLAEFCLTLPPEQMIDGPQGRPVYDRAFGDRLGPEVLRPTRRGYQQADWHELFRPEDVRSRFQQLSHFPEVSELLDLSYIAGLIDRWPASGWHRWDQTHLYRDQLLTALAMAEFLGHLAAIEAE